MRWVTKAAPRPLYPRERPGTHSIEGWVGPKAGLDKCGKSRPQRDSIPGPLSESSLDNAQVLPEQWRVTQQARRHRAMFSVTVWVSRGRGTASNISLATFPHTLHCVSTDMHPYLYQRTSDPVHAACD
jgi:hypothetical protein